MATHVKVVARVRPFIDNEAQRSAVHGDLSSSTVVVRDGKGRDRSFELDEVYAMNDSSDGQRDRIFEDIGSPALDRVLQEENSCIIAFGAGNTGKTMVMQGWGVKLGLIPSCMTRLIEERAPTGPQIRISYLEIHNECVVDLLQPRSSAQMSEGGLQVLEHPAFGVFMPGLAEIPVQTIQDAQQHVWFAMCNNIRAFGHSNLNMRSSRCHTIFTIRIVSGKTTTQLDLVDLAASERMPLVDRGVFRKPDRLVDTSLKALRSVVLSLSKSPTKVAKTVPQAPRCRASKLTMILQHVLLGRCHAAFIATISPTEVDASETINTLEFAMLVRGLQTSPMQSTRTSTMVERLQEEVNLLEEYMRAADAQGRRSICASLRIEFDLRQQLLDKLTDGPDSWELTGERIFSMQGREIASHGLAYGQEQFSDTPALINISESPLLSGLLYFEIKAGVEATIGRDKDSSIRVQGPGIPNRLCSLRNDKNRRVQLHNPDGNRVLVDGVRVQGSRTVAHNSHIILGYSRVMRILIPQSATENIVYSTKTFSDCLSDARVDQRQAAQLSSFSEALPNHLKQNRMARTLLNNAFLVVEEANAIAERLKFDSVMHFKVVRHSLYGQVCDAVEEVENEIGVQGCDVQGAPVQYWSYAQFCARLEALRDACDEIDTCGKILGPPWYVPSAAVEARACDEEAQFRSSIVSVLDQNFEYGPYPMFPHLGAQVEMLVAAEVSQKSNVTSKASTPSISCRMLRGSQAKLGSAAACMSVLRGMSSRVEQEPMEEPPTNDPHSSSKSFSVPRNAASVAQACCLIKNKVAQELRAIRQLEAEIAEQHNKNSENLSVLQFASQELKNHNAQKTLEQGRLQQDKIPAQTRPWSPAYPSHMPPQWAFGASGVAAPQGSFWVSPSDRGLVEPGVQNSTATLVHAVPAAPSVARSLEAAPLLSSRGRRLSPVRQMSPPARQMSPPARQVSPPAANALPVHLHSWQGGYSHTPRKAEPTESGSARGVVRLQSLPNAGSVVRLQSGSSAGATLMRTQQHQPAVVLPPSRTHMALSPRAARVPVPADKAAHNSKVQPICPPTPVRYRLDSPLKGE